MSEDETEIVFPKVRDTFYIIASRNLNGSLDINSEGKDAFTLQDAIDAAVCVIADHGDTWFVIECRAVRSVTPRSPIVRKVATR